MTQTTVQQTLSHSSQKRFRDYLQAEFLRRCRVNKNYSMRAFARDVDLDQSLLSKLLRGKRDFTPSSLQKIASNLSLTPKEIASYLNQSTSNKHLQIEEDCYHIFSDWFHFAILELVKTKSFQNDIKWISETLNLTQTETKEALERLERIGFIEQTENEILLLKPDNKWANLESTTRARKKLQEELSVKNTEAIQHVPFSQRENASLTIACNSNILPEVKSKIQTFWQELDDFIESKGEADHVYQLTVGFFPLTYLGDQNEQTN